LVRVLGPVVQSLLLAMLDVEPKILVCRRVALELVGDQNPRGAAVLLQQLSHEPLGRVLVAAALHQHVEQRAVLVDRRHSQCFLPLK